MMDEELLISLVRDRRELYDTQHKQYEDNHRREAAWQEIAKSMQRPAHECKERWKQLRDNYRKARKLRQTKKAQGVKKLKAIKHDKIMSFIFPIIESNKDDPTDAQGYESAGSSMTLDRHVEEQGVQVDPLTVLESNHYETPKPGTIVAFFTNLAETVKTFPEDVQIRVKRDIFKIINEAEEEVCRKKLKINHVGEINMKYELNDL